MGPMESPTLQLPRTPLRTWRLQWGLGLVALQAQERERRRDRCQIVVTNSRIGVSCATPLKSSELSLGGCRRLITT